MCDFLSWGILSEDLQKKHHLPHVLALDDDMRQSLIDKDMDAFSTIGHFGIAKYYGLNEDEFDHHEGKYLIHPDLVERVNNGNFDGAAALGAGKDFAPKYRYYPSGNVKRITYRGIEPIRGQRLLDLLPDFFAQVNPSEQDKQSFTDKLQNAVEERPGADLNKLGMWTIIFGEELVDYAYAYWYCLTGQDFGLSGTKYESKALKPVISFEPKEINEYYVNSSNHALMVEPAKEEANV